MPATVNLTDRYGLSRRTLEIVRAKLRKIGLIKRVSHFNPSFGYQPGWTFSPALHGVLSAFSDSLRQASQRPARRVDEEKDRASILYV